MIVFDSSAMIRILVLQLPAVGTHVANRVRSMFGVIEEAYKMTHGPTDGNLAEHVKGSVTYRVCLPADQIADGLALIRERF